MSDPALWTLAEAAAAIAARRISSRELLQACLDRVVPWQRVTNAFRDLRAEAAMEAAAAADLQAPRSALHGIPLAHKDMYYRQGEISTCGSALRRDWRADTTATVLRRLDSAGALDLGTLNMSEWAGGATGHNIWFGDVCNPWNPDYASGGSSAGSGAAVSARMLFGSLGSDTGGSIRLPAAMCGVAGLKPTWGAVSRHGVMPRAWTLDAVGPLARTAEDCGLIFAAIAGADPQDPTSLNARAFRPPRRPDTLRGLVVGVETAMLDTADAALQPSLQTALALLRDLGAEIQEVAIPDLPAVFDLGGIISGTEAASIHLEQMRTHPDGYAPDLFHRMQAGLAMPAVLYLEALRSRAELLRRTQAAVFERCAALFCPTIAMPVPTREASRTHTAADVGRIHGPLVRLTRPFNMLGLPSLSLPCGFDRNGLPVGFQLVGAPFDEAGILGIGMAYEHAAGWLRRAPALPVGAGAARAVG